MIIWERYETSDQVHMKGQQGCERAALNATQWEELAVALCESSRMLKSTAGNIKSDLWLHMV